MSKGNRRIKARRVGSGLKSATAAVARFVRRIFWVSLVVGVGYIVVRGGDRLRKSPMFRVAHVQVTGNARVPTEEILAFAALKLGESIFEVSLDAVVTGVRRHPWVSEVSVRRRLPDQLLLSVVEHKPALLVSLGGLYVANKEGQPFKPFSPRDGLVLPVLTGLDRDLAVKEPDAAIERIREGIALAVGFERHANVLGRLEELHWDDDLGWSTVARTGKGVGTALRVHLGRAPLPRLGLAHQAMLVLAEGARVPLVIWADGVKHPDLVHVQFADPSTLRPGSGQASLRAAGDNGQAQSRGHEHG